MRELRAQIGGRTLRVFYALDPWALGNLAHCGDKTCNNCFHERMVSVADN
jgi:hypothetical protein